MRISIIFFAILVLFLSCGKSGKQKSNQTESTENKIIIGKITENVKCLSKPEYTYGYYLPSYYEADKKYPAIIIFDAHARAYLSLSKFKEIAEEYGYILVASATARNGLKDINAVINNLWSDIFQTFQIDKHRVYTAGFSGGAKIATSVAIYKGGIKGVIACSAGMPSLNQKITNKFDYVGVVGLDDFNYQEMNTLNNTLQDLKFNSSLLNFNGAHYWAPSHVLKKAIRWLHFMNMKQSDLSIDNQAIRNYTLSMADTINKLFEGNKMYETYKLYDTFIKDMDGLYDISEYKENFDKLAKNPKVIEGIKAESDIKQTEIKKQEKILSLFKSENYTEIDKQIMQLTKDDKKSNHLDNRLLNFIGMVSYIYVKASVESNNSQKFLKLIKIYESIKTNLPYAHYFRACKASMDNDLNLALQYLQKAVNSGYYDVFSISEPAYFNELKKLPEFDIILKKAAINSKKPTVK